MTRIRRRLAIAAFAMLLPIAAVRLWDYIEVRRFIAEIEAIRAKGEPITEQEAGRQRTPSSEATEQTGRVYLAASLLVPQGAVDKELLAIREWLQGETFPDYIGAQTRVANRPDQAAFDRLRAAVATHQQAIALVDEASQLPFDGFPPGTTFNYTAAHLSGLASLLTARTVTRAFAGEGDAALDAVLVSLNYRRTLRELRPSWLRWPDYQTAAALSLSAPSVEALQRVRLALAAEDRPDDRIKDLYGARARALGYMWTALYRTQVTAPESYRLPQGLLDVALRPWLGHQAVDAVRTWAEVVEAARQPVIAVPDPSPAERVAFTAARGGSGMMWKGVAYQALTHAAQAEDLGIDRASLAAIGVELYRRTHGGALPATIGEIVPEHLDAVPLDPATGQPLRYTRDGSSYSLTGAGRLRMVIHH